MNPIRLGTRSSALALWQAHWVQEQLQKLGVDVEVIHIKTQGDVKSGPIGQIGERGVFTKEIQRALLDQSIDLAVHSLKDMPTEAVPGLQIGAVPAREVNSDAFVSNSVADLDSLPAGAKVGTGSNRRKAQLLSLRPELDVLDIRGNVGTRLQKLDDGEYDAIILAEAGLRRLKLANRITQLLPKDQMVPAVGQGALGLEVRDNDSATLQAILPLNHFETYQAVMAERAMLSALRGGCLAPVGAWARSEAGRLILDGVVLSTDGRVRLETHQEGPIDFAEDLGEKAAIHLADQGAREIIAAERTS